MEATSNDGSVPFAAACARSSPAFTAMIAMLMAANTHLRRKPILSANRHAIMARIVHRLDYRACVTRGTRTSSGLVRASISFIIIFSWGRDGFFAPVDASLSRIRRGSGAALRGMDLLGAAWGALVREGVRRKRVEARLGPLADRLDIGRSEP